MKVVSSREISPKQGSGRLVVEESKCGEVDVPATVSVIGIYFGSDAIGNSSHEIRRILFTHPLRPKLQAMCVY